MKYIAFLRGINVGGNSLIKMTELTAAIEKAGYTHVSTYINSGNVLFESGQKDTAKMEEMLEKLILMKFNISSRVVVMNDTWLKKVLDNVPKNWKTKNNIRCYVAFVKKPVTPKDVMKEMTLKEGVDFAEAGPGVVYMTTLLSGLMKSGLKNLIAKKIYKELTMRNYTTVKKVMDLIKGTGVRGENQLRK